VQFSEPTYGIGQAFLVAKGNPKGVSDYGSIAGNHDLKLAVMSGAVEAGYAKDSGVAEDQLVILPDQSSLVKAVQAELQSEPASTTPPIRARQETMSTRGAKADKTSSQSLSALTHFGVARVR
jgi:hypothetical protein